MVAKHQTRGRRGRGLASVGLAAGLLLAPGPAPAAVRNADSLLIVDCLLPGKIRRLGNQATYVTARRAVKTTASECGARGGEYTAYDRASYATSMAVWLPLAKAGDPEAQANLGEILEKGLGGAPQPDLAVQWYQLAAEQGSARAQLNLGSMYERGLGVPRDPARAVEWYRKASGLAAANVPYVPLEDVTALRQERDALSRELEAERAERARLQQELDAVRGRLERDRGALERSQGDLEAARRELAARSQAQRATEPELAALRQDVERRDAELRRIVASVADLERRASALQGQLQSTEARRVADVSSAQAEAQAARAELARLTGRLESAEAALNRGAGRAEAQDAEVARLRRELGQASATAAARADIERRLQAREGELAETRRALESLSAEKARLEREAGALRQTAARAEQARASAAPPVITLVEPLMPRMRAGEAGAEIPLGAGRRMIVGKVEAGAGLATVLVNGSEVRVDPGGLVRAEVMHAGERTPVQIVAVDSRGQRSDLSFSLVREQAAAASRAASAGGGMSLPAGFSFGRYHALVIGNNDYGRLQKLETAVNDARAVDEVLRTRYGFKTTLLLNADRYQLLSALNRLREELTDKDNLLIYYAGHGELDRVNNRGHWLPVDAEPNSSANWISAIQITDVLNAMSAKQVLLVADSCYSGTLTRAAVASLDAGMSEEERLRWLKAMATKKARVVLTSGGVQPVLDGGGGDHSVFAAAFLEALRSNTGVLESARLAQGVIQRVAVSDAAGSIDQVPVYAPIRFAGHEAGDFFFVAKN